ncbi:hypothetical protein K9U39_08095 [Rhodoblastus acidophilus]|uniref:Uncharacterized protein n=1 Tax=Candidatus Rhodoblastus alkanivorans TaxID=2954117 RepID=A0ABS9Z7E1_9HYPH|nr:hypothetical protein [Candidatus Rhodoblastus alkanivorans]MCI4678332.1 hypothetical protein [Candidatus Rhodoblastus alkanivorans]MCI4683590.1 hypothetical protein [Candidatus Rhodoblastus alkanivorans]MDI4640906.1 hypothetical protein [Rhodoblastus acidophilus]
MPMNEEAIEAGKCYSAGAENYKVIAITRSIVTYQAWPKGGKLNPLRINCGLKAFAAAVRKEIACPAAP